MVFLMTSRTAADTSATGSLSVLAADAVPASLRLRAPNSRARCRQQASASLGEEGNLGK